jgi:hypothetical protein
MKKSLATVVCLLTAMPVFAADGAIPIWEPTTITQPGKYVLTRNIINADSVIIIESNDVALDLNGFTVETTVIFSAAVEVREVDNVAIENGYIRAASMGIFMPFVNGDTLASLIVRNASVFGGTHAIASQVSSERIVITRNRIDGSLSLAETTNSTIAHNVIDSSYAISGNFRNSEIGENSIDCNGHCATGPNNHSHGDNYADWGSF